MRPKSSKPRQRRVFRWLAKSIPAINVAIAIIVAFPMLIGSEDGPDYPLAVAFFFLAIVFWIKDYKGDFSIRGRKKR